MCSGWLRLRQVRHITVHAAVIICYLHFIKYSILGLEQQYIMLSSRQAQISHSEHSG
jgi:transcriptional regulator of NAD metabolism